MTYGTIDGMLHSIIKAGLAVRTSGNIDNELGQFHLVHIPADADERAEMSKLVFADESEADDYETEADIFNRTETGWHLVTLRNMGRVVSFPCEDEADAQYDFESIRREYLRYLQTGQ